MKRYLSFSVALTALLLAAFVAACGAGPAPIISPDEATASPTQGDEEHGSTAIPTAELEKEHETVAPTPKSPTDQAPNNATPISEEIGFESPSDAEQTVQLAREDLAQRLDLEPDAIQLLSVEALNWSDTSLGCPQPGMAYAQVITPGFRVVLEAEGHIYRYHTDAGRFVILCPRDGLDVVPLMPVAPHGIPGKPPVPGH